MRRPEGRKLIDLEMLVHHETDGAFIASATGERKDAVALPKSVVDVEWRLARRELPARAVLTMPEWLAIEKGLA